MSSSSTSVIQPTGLVHGHGECRYLDETIPVLSHILALELVDRRDGEATMKHPNTGWKLILHEGGPDVKDKPERNHYGVRVSNNQEVDNAYQYLLAEKEKLGLKKVVKRKERDGSYSMFFVEPGGNYWEIESYENRHKDLRFLIDRTGDNENVRPSEHSIHHTAPACVDKLNIAADERLCCQHPAAHVYQLSVNSVLSENPRIFSDPYWAVLRRDRRVRDADCGELSGSVCRAGGPDNE
jgi:hypothetical protein